MEGKETIIYEARTVLPEKDKPTYFYFNSFEAADLWLADFDNGEITGIPVSEPPALDYETIFKALEDMERQEREAEESEDE